MTPAARRALVTLAATFAVVTAPLAVPAFREPAWTLARLLAGGDTAALRAYLLGFGAWAPVVSALLMVGQAIVAPLPAFVVTLANGLLFGALWGGLLSWSSALVGAWLCFWLARALGRPFAERLIGRVPLEAADRFFARYGFQAIFLARLLPFVPFDPISYAAGLTRMGSTRFLVGTGLGQMPATALYSYAGQEATRGVAVVLWVLGATALAGVVARAIQRRRAVRRVAGRGPAADPSATLR